MPTKKIKVNSTKRNLKSKVAVKKAASSVKKDVMKKTIATKEAGASKKGLLTIEFFDLKGVSAEKVTLPKEIFNAKINDKLMAQAVRVYLANQRGGFASTKTRENVHGSTRKIYAQKHTGHARHGSRKAPIFIHGGIAHGPHPRDFSLNLSKKMKKLALFSALSSKLENSEIKGIVGFEEIKPKTKLLAEAFLKLGIAGKSGRTLIVMPNKTEKFENFQRAARNIEGIKLIPANILNTYEVLQSKILLLVKPSINDLSETFLKGGNK